MHLAAFGERVQDKVICHLCPHECNLTDGKRGICVCRFNRNGELVTDNYGELVSLAVDPIEKKPLYHFYPGTGILSTGCNCCNLGCLNCQNWTISQEKSPTVYKSPDELTELALRHKSLGVAFTYTEPMVWFEYIMDTAPLLHDHGLNVVLVTNGFINPKPLAELIAVTDAMNIDLKSIRPEFYTRVCKGMLEPVMETIRLVAASDVHLEVTNLLIPGLNDSDADIEHLAEFVASLSEKIPLHFSAYHPDYKMDKEATPAETVLHAVTLARKHLVYVYAGNIHMENGSDTFCPACGNLLIRRAGFRAKVVGVRGGRCAQCHFDTGIRQ
ncbi:AmmeMemoRadiSam system radical SAM enzyme [candidate division GN15 bacterium]|uniref:AmmeMemoRadiSam system radical SAM enzyme n=1 Tax=candidate division GN15 bacterium TaxID=2072418 RepID=A0A855XCR9_9BACT|nr:MAG: AmmeMemoRadiSam system radical SAM enzyme [candidate division GN15 bacterium]